MASHQLYRLFAQLYAPDRNSGLVKITIADRAYMAGNIYGTKKRRVTSGAFIVESITKALMSTWGISQ